MSTTSDTPSKAGVPLADDLLAALDAYAARALAGRSGAASSFVALLWLHLRSPGQRARLMREAEQHIAAVGKQRGWSWRARRTPRPRRAQAAEAVLRRRQQVRPHSASTSACSRSGTSCTCRCSSCWCSRPSSTSSPSTSIEQEPAVWPRNFGSAGRSAPARDCNHDGAFTGSVREAGNAGTSHRRARAAGEELQQLSRALCASIAVGAVPCVPQGGRRRSTERARLPWPPSRSVQGRVQDVPHRAQGAGIRHRPAQPRNLQPHVHELRS